MDRADEKRLKKNERDRLAYKNMSAEKKTQLLERRRQQYMQRKAKSQSETKILGDSSIASVDHSTNLLESTTTKHSLPQPAAESGIPSHNVAAIGLCSIVLSCGLENASNVECNDQWQEGSSASRSLSNRYKRILDVPTSRWQLPNANPCIYCNAFRFSRETPSFCCSNGQGLSEYHRRGKDRLIVEGRALSNQFLDKLLIVYYKLKMKCTARTK